MARKNKNGLTDQQQTFADEYLKDPEQNATSAYRKAYPKSSEKAAESGASRALRNGKVAKYIQDEMDKRSERTGIDKDYVLSSLQELAEMCMGRKEVPKSVIIGDQAMEVEVKEVNPSGAAKALELLGKNLKLFTDKTELTGPNGGALQVESKTMSVVQGVAAKK